MSFNAWARTGVRKKTNLSSTSRKCQVILQKNSLRMSNNLNMEEEKSLRFLWHFQWHFPWHFLQTLQFSWLNLWWDSNLILVRHCSQRKITAVWKEIITSPTIWTQPVHHFDRYFEFHFSLAHCRWIRYTKVSFLFFFFFRFAFYSLCPNIISKHLTNPNDKMKLI